MDDMRIKLNNLIRNKITWNTGVSGRFDNFWWNEMSETGETSKNSDSVHEKYRDSISGSSHKNPAVIASWTVETKSFTYAAIW